MNAFEMANGNTLTVMNSTFKGNTANLGGGACNINLRVRCYFVVTVIIVLFCLAG